MENNNEAQKMLDQYIHDYFVRKNMHASAEAFARETNLQPGDIDLDGGFLSEWWSLFWDVYSSRPGFNPAGNQASTSTSQQTSSAFVAPNAFPVSAAPVVPNNPPPRRRRGRPRTVPRPVEQPFMPPPKKHNTELIDFHQFSHCPDIGSSSYHMEQFNSWQQNPMDTNIGTSLGRSITLDLPPLAPTDNVGTSLGRSIALDLPPPPPTDSAGCQADRVHELAAQASGKQIISESSTRMVSPTLVDDDSKGKGLLIEMDEITDEAIDHFFSIGENEKQQM